MENNYEHILTRAGIRVTSNRVLVLRIIHESIHSAFSMKDFLAVWPYMDESSVFRTLSLFAEKQVLHTIDDGTGVQKYCLCQCHHHDEGCDGHHHGHVHLTCVVCHHTFCLEDVEIPKVQVPEGYEVREAEYIIKCVCPKCRHNN